MESQSFSHFESAYFAPYEEEWCGYVIYIEENPDRYRGGFAWSVSKEDEEITMNLAFSPEDALVGAKLFITSRENSYQ